MKSPSPPPPRLSFFALDQEGRATETEGEVYFGVLHWSGNLSISVERQFGKRVSVTGGIQDRDCRYILKPGEAFETPKFTGGFVARGFGRMSEVFYDLAVRSSDAPGQKNG